MSTFKLSDVVYDDFGEFDESIRNQLFELINTKEILAIKVSAHFQRLKGIKQLGCVSNVFAYGGHSRYEHCVGTSLITALFLLLIEKNYNQQIPLFLKKCVVIAALLHDVGHAPFSHMWEKYDHNFDHEEMSCVLIKDLFKKLPVLNMELKGCDELICNLVLGKNSEVAENLGEKYRKYLFITEIVKNSRNDVDVDKLDYLMRDLYYTKDSQESKKLREIIYDILNSARVSLKGDHISFHKNQLGSIRSIFLYRHSLHVECYQHPAVLLQEEKILAGIRSYGDSGGTFNGIPLLEVPMYIEMFLKFTDEFIEEKCIALGKNYSPRKVNQIFDFPCIKMGKLNDFDFHDDNYVPYHFDTTIENECFCPPELLARHPQRRQRIKFLREINLTRLG